MSNDIKTFVVGCLSAFISLITPIQDFMVAMLLLFALNFIVGYFADMSQGNGWSFTKAMQFVKHSAMFFVLLASFFVIGKFLHRNDEAVTCVSTVCLIALWVFSVNILRNLKHVLNEESAMHKLVSILYYIISIQVAEKWSVLSGYINNNKTEDEEV